MRPLLAAAESKKRRIITPKHATDYSIKIYYNKAVFEPCRHVAFNYTVSFTPLLVRLFLSVQIRQPRILLSNTH